MTDRASLHLARLNAQAKEGQSMICQPYDKATGEGCVLCSKSDGRRSKDEYYHDCKAKRWDYPADEPFWVGDGSPCFCDAERRALHLTQAGLSPDVVIENAVLWDMLQQSCDVCDRLANACNTCQIFGAAESVHASVAAAVAKERKSRHDAD